MKKIIYIAFALFAFGMTSCNKQDIQPNANAVSQEPVWRSSDDDEGGYEEGGGNEEGGGTITDPNNDPDGSRGSQ